MTKLRGCNVNVGSSYSGFYLRYNYHGLPEKREPRRFTVLEVRDTKKNPIEAETKKLNPSLNRGRWLARCWDLDKGAERSFYLESMKHLSELPEEEIIESLPCSSRYLVIDEGGVRYQSPERLNALLWMRRLGRGLLCKVLCSEVSGLLRENKSRSKRA